MDIKIWQAVIVPLFIACMTLSITWIHNSASISHQRTQRLRELVQSGAWRTAHSFVLIMDVREAFGIRSSLDARALRLALAHQDNAFKALKYYLSARDFVHISEDGYRFLRSKSAKSSQIYGSWIIWTPIISLTLYTALISLSAHFIKIGYTEAYYLLPIAVLCPFIGIKLATGFHAADLLMKLPITTIENQK